VSGQHDIGHAQWLHNVDNHDCFAPRFRTFPLMIGDPGSRQGVELNSRHRFFNPCRLRSDPQKANQAARSSSGGSLAPVMKATASDIV
jgi:hypothetical protein